jgi:NAD-dependent dihydropyrimidine dehydrogenase PreA subunit
MAALFINVEVDAAVARDAAVVRKLVEVCPVNIFAQAPDQALQIVEKNLDECTLCELCLDAAPPGAVRIKKLYGEGEVVSRQA